jgi:hypothetical protein
MKINDKTGIYLSVSCFDESPVFIGRNGDVMQGERLFEIIFGIEFFSTTLKIKAKQVG